MRKNQSSLTAAGIAIVRAVESEKPADERICYDTYARIFLKERIFRETQDVNTGDLKLAYFTGKNIGRKIAGGYGIAIGKE
jgi:O-methyltransferase involved in polyketide biosynthesis